MPLGSGMYRNSPAYNRVGGGGYAAKQKAIEDKYKKEVEGLGDPNSEFSKGYSEREANLKSQYAQTRSAMEAQKIGRESEIERGLARQAAISGGVGGGAQAKMLQKGQTELGREFGSLEAGLGAEQAAALEGLSGQKAQERLAREEAARAGKQFEQTLEFQSGSFADQMSYNWAELDENKKTNMINAAALLQDTGLSMERILPQLRYFYGDSRAPRMLAGRSSGTGAPVYY